MVDVLPMLTVPPSTVLRGAGRGGRRGFDSSYEELERNSVLLEMRHRKVYNIIGCCDYWLVK